MMRKYELALVISAAPNEAKIKEIINKVTDLVGQEKGKIVKSDQWKKMSLAYPINKEKEAFYVFVNFSAPTLRVEFNQKIKLINGVLRHLLLREE